MPEMIPVEINARIQDGRRRKRHSLKIDMTPMVDLGFLLISFFVMTVHLTQPYVAKFNMPADGPPSSLQESAAMTVLLSKERSVWYYYGNWSDAAKQNGVKKTSLSYRNGLGAIIRQKQLLLDENPIMRKGRDELTILIKPAANSNYTGIVDVLDEIAIHKVKRYALVRLTDEESRFLQIRERD